MLKTLDEVLVLFEEKADSVGSYFKSAKSGHPEEEIQELEDSLGLKIAANYRQVLKEYFCIQFLNYDYVPTHLSDIAKFTSTYIETRSYYDVKFPEGYYSLGMYADAPIFIQNAATGFIYEYPLADRCPAMKKVARNFTEFLNKQFDYWTAAGYFNKKFLNG